MSGTRAMAVLFLALCCLHLQAYEPRVTASKTSATGGPEEVVRLCLQRIGTNVSSIRDLFFSPDGSVIVYGQGDGSMSSQTTEEWIASAETQKQWTHVVDKISSETLQGTLAVVLVEGHTETWRTDFRSVYTLTRQGGGWQILTLVQENR